MTINDSYEFIFNNESSQQYGIVMASAIGSTSRSGNIETRNIITSKNKFSNTFSIHDVTYDNPLQFDLIVYNEDETFIDADKERILKKWLMKNKYCWLQILQDDLSSVNYYCIASSCELIDVGVETGGMKITFQSDSPWAYSDLKTKQYVCNGTSNINLFLDLDFDEYCVLPNIKVSNLGNDNTISIKNNTTNELVEFYHCVLFETILLECQSDKISSSYNRQMIDNWNKNSLSLIQDSNSITLTGYFQLTLEYRIPIRVGA
jgi:hypothetical protein